MPVKLTYTLAGSTDVPTVVIFPKERVHDDVRIMGNPTQGMTFIGSSKTAATGPLASWSLETVTDEDEVQEEQGGKKRKKDVSSITVDEDDLLVLQAALVACPTTEMHKDHQQAHAALLRRVYKLRGIEPGEEE